MDSGKPAPLPVSASSDTGDLVARVLQEVSALASAKDESGRIFFPNGIDVIEMKIAAGAVSLDLAIKGPSSSQTDYTFRSREITNDLETLTAFVQLSQTATDFKRYSPGANQWGTPATIAVPAAAAGSLHASEPTLFFSIGDISLQAGGPMPGHTSGHQLGKNIDVRPIRIDRQDKPATYHDASYDQGATQKVIDAFLAQSNVSFVIFNDPGITGSNIKRDPAGTTVHDNHFHVQTIA